MLEAYAYRIIKLLEQLTEQNKVVIEQNKEIKQSLKVIHNMVV